MQDPKLKVPQSPLRARAMLKSILGILSGAVALLNWLARRKERETYKDQGRLEAENAQLKEGIEADQRMRDAKSDKPVVDSLRNEEF